MSPIVGTGLPTLRPSSSLKIILDGNSIFYGYGGTAMHTLLGADPWLSGTGATLANVAISAQTWRMMNGLDTGSASDVDGAFASGKTNILVCMEGTNSIATAIGNKTGAAAFSDATDYIAARKAANPTLRVVLCGTLPRDGSEGHNNTEQAAYDALCRVNYRAVGAEAFIDWRAGTSIFNHDGTSAARFTADQTYWYESSAWIHPNTAGQTVMKNMLVGTLRRLRA